MNYVIVRSDDPRRYWSGMYWTESSNGAIEDAVVYTETCIPDSIAYSENGLGGILLAVRGEGK